MSFQILLKRMMQSCSFLWLYTHACWLSPALSRCIHGSLLWIALKGPGRRETLTDPITNFLTLYPTCRHHLPLWSFPTSTESSSSRRNHSQDSRRLCIWIHHSTPLRTFHHLLSEQDRQSHYCNLGSWLHYSSESQTQAWICFCQQLSYLTSYRGGCWRGC